MTSAPYQLSAATLAECLEISRYFKDPLDLKQWGGDGFIFPIQQQQFLSQLQLPDTTSFVFKRQSIVVGFGQICQRFGKHHLARLWISPDVRRQKLSYALILSLMSHAIQQNSTLDFSLFVFRHNNIAIHCYQQLGFQITTQPGAEHPSLYFMQLSGTRAQQLLASNNRTK